MSLTKESLGLGGSAITRECDYDFEQRKLFRTNEFYYTIEEKAEIEGVTPNAIRQKLKRNGSFDGAEKIKNKWWFPKNYKKDEETKKPVILDGISLYQKGIDALREAGYELVFDVHGPLCGHSLYKLEPYKTIKGITIPSSYKRLTHISKKDISLVTKAVSQCDYEMWCHLTDPENDNVRRTRLYAVGKMLYETELKATGESFDPDLKICFDPKPCILPGEPNPIALLPAREWFNEKLQQVTAEELLPIFYEAEQQAFMLFLGRTCVGPSKSRPLGWSELLEHDARLAVVLHGAPKIGKSATIAMIKSALEKVGYKTHEFEDPGQQFGMGEIADANFVVQDDTTVQQLKKLVTSDRIKKFISNTGTINAEKKMRDAKQVRAICSMCLATNDFDPYILFGSDSGCLDRFAILSCKSFKNRDAGGIERSPGRVWSRIAKETDSSVDAVALWLCRLSTELFMEHCPNIQVYVDKLKSRFRTPVITSPLKSVIQAMKLSNALRGCEDYKDLFSEQVFNNCIACFRFVMLNSFSQPILAELKRQWESQGRPMEHIWIGYRIVSLQSLEDINETDSFARTKRQSISDKLKCLYDNQQTHLCGSPGVFASEWKATMDDNSYIEDLSKNILSSLPMAVKVKYAYDGGNLRDYCSVDYGQWCNPSNTADQITSSRIEAYEKFMAKFGGS